MHDLTHVLHLSSSSQQSNELSHAHFPFLHLRKLNFSGGMESFAYRHLAPKWPGAEARCRVLKSTLSFSMQFSAGELGMMELESKLEFTEIHELEHL